MRGKLDDADLAVFAGPAHDHTGALELRAVLRVQSIVAVERLGHAGGAAVETSGERTRHDAHRLRLPDERAGQRRDDEPARAGVSILLMVGVLDPENVARDLDDRVLKAASGSDERDTPFPRIAHRRDRPLHVAVGTPRGDQQPAEPS